MSIIEAPPAPAPPAQAPPVDIRSVDIPPVDIPPVDIPPVGVESGPPTDVTVVGAPALVVRPPAPVVGGLTQWQARDGQPDLFPAVLGELGVGSDLDDWLERFILAVLEVLSARRPARQLDLALAIPVRLNIKRAIRPDARPELVSVRSQRTGHGTIEASAHLRVGCRSVAAAFRLTRTAGRWVCTAWQLRPEDLLPARAA